MKNTKLTKLLVMILSLVLLVGSAIAVAVSAADAEDTTYAIKSINISHKDSIHVLIAVDAPAADAANIEVKYTLGNGEEKTAAYQGLIDIYKDGNEYPVFYTVGVPMKDMGESIKAEAHKVGTTPASPKYMDVSVANYLYTKLYQEGYAFATEGQDLGRKNLYLNLLEYGAKAQEVLWNNKHPEAIRPLVTDIIPVHLNGDVSMAGETGLVKLDKEGYVDLKYTGSELLTGWKVSTVDGTKVYYNNVYLTKGARITPVTAEAGAAYGFEDEFTETFEAVANDASGNETKANVLTFASGVVVKYGRSASSNAGNAKASVKTEGTNKFLNIYAPIRANNERNHGISGGDIWTPTAVTDDANVYVMSFDARANSALNGNLQFVFRFSGGYTQFNTSGSSLGAINVMPNSGWNNVRFEYYSVQHVLQIYVNGAYVGDYVAGSAEQTSSGYTKFEDMGADLTSMEIALVNSGAAIDIDFDNIATYKTTKTYVVYPGETADPSVIDFAEGTYTQDTWTVLTNGDPNLEIKTNDGRFESLMDGTGRTNTSGKNLSEVVDGVYHNYSPGRVGADSDRSHGVAVYPESLVPDYVANATVVEFDFRYNAVGGNGALRFGVRTGNTFLYFHATASATDISFPTVVGSKFADIGEWVRLKFVFRYDEKKASLYADGNFLFDLTFDQGGDRSPATSDAFWEAIGIADYFSLSTYNANGVIDFYMDNVSCYNTLIID